MQHDPERYMPPTPPPWGWLTVDHPVSGEHHAFPTWDLGAHAFDEQCPCGPYLENEVWMHNSFDGREAYEAGRKRH